MRGKAAAQNANRRANEAQERIAELEARLRDQDRRHSAEAATLQAERDQAMSRLIREVDTLAGEAVAAAEASALQVTQEAHEQCDERIANGFAWLCRTLGNQMPSDLKACAEAFQVQPALLINAQGDSVFNRRTRRMSGKQIRNLNAFHKEKKISRNPMFGVDP